MTFAHFMAYLTPLTDEKEPFKPMSMQQVCSEVRKIQATLKEKK